MDFLHRIVGNNTGYHGIATIIKEQSYKDVDFQFVRVEEAPGHVKVHCFVNQFSHPDLLSNGTLWFHSYIT